MYSVTKFGRYAHFVEKKVCGENVEEENRKPPAI
jgi:hypothetical protein